MAKRDIEDLKEEKGAEASRIEVVEEEEIGAEEVAVTEEEEATLEATSSQYYLRVLLDL